MTPPASLPVAHHSGNSPGFAQRSDLLGAETLLCQHFITMRTQLNGGSFYDCYETADGRWFSVGGIEPQFFSQFCQAIGRPDLAGRGLAMLPEIVAEVKAGIREAMKQKTFAEWEKIFAALDCCTEPVLSFSEACQHPQIVARNMLVEVPTPGGARQRQVASPFKFSRTAPEYRFSGTRLGSHSDEVLAEQGFSAEQIAALRKSGAVA
jgi:crotonobetainyl-CoA:carnitine CoA-transferase CaiB-like acyl-CoA transferase